MITIDSATLRDKTLVLALAVVGERIRSLPKEDREDMYEITKAFISSDDEEERESAAVALLEILEQTNSRLGALEPSDGIESLKGWTAFVSSRIKELRAAASITQEELAKKSGLTQSHISRLEAGQHSPNGMTLKKLADALGVPLSKLDPNARKGE